MKKVRRANTHCLNCGGQMPGRVDIETNDNNIVDYICPDCGDSIIKGAAVSGARTLDTGRPMGTPRHNDEPQIPNSASVGIWEKWWTNQRLVSAVHGRVIAGDKELYEYVQKLTEKHECPF